MNGSIDRTKNINAFDDDDIDGVPIARTCSDANVVADEDENEMEYEEEDDDEKTFINNDNNILQMLNDTLLENNDNDDEDASKGIENIEECKFTRIVPSRKRIYGKEFRESNQLTVQPRFHDLKLNQPIFENVVNLQNNQCSIMNDTNSSGIDDNENATINVHRRSLVHHPTNTERSFIRYNIDNNKVPDICSKCYSIKCICNFLK